MRIFIFGLLAFCLALSVDARVFGVIDNFATLQPPVVLVVAVGNSPPSSYSWYSPYSPSNPPTVAYHTTTDCFGGQRDVVLGYITTTPVNTVSIASIVAESGSIAFALNYVGGAYFQYDGVDNGGSTAAFPGSVLNRVPGLPTANRDFTFGGRARYITCTIFADHPVSYFFDAIDTAGVENTITLDVFPVSETIPVLFTVDFNDPDWDNVATFNWANVAAFQVRIFTFRDSGSSAAVDTSFKFLQITGYEVTGSVVVDCSCDTTIESAVANTVVTLQNPSNGATIDTTTTDSSGDFEFLGLPDGNYRACISSSLTRCSGTPQCRDFTLANLVDPAPLIYSTTVASVLTIPPNALDLECGDCTSVACLGSASLSGCSGTQQVNTFNDNEVGNSCRRTISRTWTAGGQSLTQIIVVTDTEGPALTTPAQSLTFACSAITTPITTWIANNGNAVATDCSVITWTNNWDNVAPIRCGFDTVTFTARDPCSNTPVSTTATYTLTDNVAPVISPPATNNQAQCDLKTNSDQSALNNWVSTRGGAQATDNCNPSVTWTNNFTSLASGCSNTATVTFTASDGCGNSSPTTASFTISDTQNPVITVPASNQAAQCSSSGSGAQTSFTTWRNDHGGARATDQCVTNDNQLIWTDNFTGTISGGCSNPIPVTFTVTDLCGRSSSTSATFTVQDNSGPLLVTPASPLTVECGDNVSNQYNNWLATQGGALATDACTAVSWSNNAPINPPSNSCNGVVTVTFVATDSCSNPSVSTTAIFTVRDTIPPTFVTPPQNSGTECSTNVNALFNSWLTSNAGAVASDSCSNPTTILNDFPSNGTPAVGCNAVTSVRFTAVDACNRSSAPITATYTITDTTRPVISPTAQDELSECSSTTQTDYQSFLLSRGGAIASDFCSSFVWSHNGPATVTLGCNIATTVTFTVTDACSNAAQTTATFTVIDTEEPVLTLAATDLTTECSAASQGSPVTLTNWLNARGGAAAQDACSTVIWTNDFDDLDITGACTASATVTFTASDSCGFNVATSAVFTVRDSTAPVINPTARPASAQCDPDDTDVNAFQAWVNDHGGARATDNCVPEDLLVWTADTGFPNLDTCSTTVVTFTVSDGCGGSSRTTSTFTIIDTINPTFNPPPQDLTVECDGSGNVDDYDAWVDTFAGAIAEDACAITLTYSATAAAVGPVGCGSTPITVTVADECSNAVIQSAIYRVVDTLPPTITVPATDATVQCGSSTANNQAVLDFLNSRAGAQASDVCYPTVAWTNNFVGLSNAVCNPSARVTFTATDGCANSQTTTATITIVDTLNPTLTSAAVPTVIECNADTNPQTISTYVTSRGGAQAVDSCSAVVWTSTFTFPPTPCAGPLPITFTATDSCGNRISSTGSIEIVDSVAPEFVNFPPDAKISCDQFEDPDLTGTPGVFDVCSQVLEPTYVDSEFQEPGEKFCPGDVIITRRWTIVDACGNTNVRDQIIVQEIARRVGPCLPTECPPCEFIECCTTPLDEVECNAVACIPVVCQTVHCLAVPCIPQACGTRPTPTGRPQGPVPLPSTIPAPSCEPVYIYVFDDDGEDNDIPDVVPIYGSASSASVLGLSTFFSLVVILLAIL